MTSSSARKQSSAPLAASLTALLLVGGCASVATPPEEVTAAVSPGAKTDGSDRSDHACTIVLREARVIGEDCRSGTCRQTFEARVEVDRSALVHGSRVSLLFHREGASDWWQAEARRTTDTADPSIVSVWFESSSESRAIPGRGAGSIEMIPFLGSSGGGRLFDHNGTVDDHQNYVLSDDNGWAIAVDTCTGGVPRWRDVDAVACEMFVELVNSWYELGDDEAHASFYLRTDLTRLDGPIRAIGFHGIKTVEDGAPCRDCGVWTDWLAPPVLSAPDEHHLDFMIWRDDLGHASWEGAFFVETTAGTRYWAKPEGGQNVMIDRALLDRIDAARGRRGGMHGGFDGAITTADLFPYLNPGRCR